MMKQLGLAFLLSVVCTAVAAAQGNPEQAVKNARDQSFDIKNRSIELERMKRTVNQPTVVSDSTRDFPEIKEDFEKIQKINSDILQPAAAKSLLDYAEISKSAANINRRAVRLKANLFAAESDENAKNKKRIVDQSENVGTLLKFLDESINSFVHNSIFQNTNLVNPADSLKAQNDLEVLIKISSQIKSKAMKIAKGSAKD